MLRLLKISYAWVIELTAEIGENIEKHIIMTVMTIAMVLLSTWLLPRQCARHLTCIHSFHIARDRR